MPKKAKFVGSFSDVRQIPTDNRPQIAFAGRSNVGKSTLLNRLVNRKNLAKTSKTPGRTQLVNFFLIDDKYYFVDLPGYGYARASVRAVREWGKLVNNFLEGSRNLKGLIFLMDCRRDPNEDDLIMLDWMENREVEYIVVLTKTDKISKSNMLRKARQINDIFRVDPILFSSLSGIGRKELVNWIEGVIRN